MAQLFMRIRGIDDIKGASEIKGDAQLSKMHSFQRADQQSRLTAFPGELKEALPWM